MTTGCFMSCCQIFERGAIFSPDFLPGGVNKCEGGWVNDVGGWLVLKQHNTVYSKVFKKVQFKILCRAEELSMMRKHKASNWVKPQWYSLVLCHSTIVQFLEHSEQWQLCT